MQSSQKHLSQRATDLCCSVPVPDASSVPAAQRAVPGLAWPSAAVAAAGLLAGLGRCCTVPAGCGHGAREGLGSPGSGPCCSRCCRGPAPVPCRVTPRRAPWPGREPTPGAAAIERLCVSRHKVRIDADSPPPAGPSRAANGSHKGALLPLLRTGCQRADGEHHTAGWSSHSFCAGAGNLLILSLAQADLAAARVPAGAAGPSCTGPSMVRQGLGSVQQQALHQGAFGAGWRHDVSRSASLQCSCSCVGACCVVLLACWGISSLTWISVQNGLREAYVSIHYPPAPPNM